MSLQGFYFILELVLVLYLLRVHLFEVLNFPFEGSNLLLSELMCNPSIVIQVAKLLPSVELLIIHLSELALSLEVLVILCLKVLDLTIKFL